MPEGARPRVSTDHGAAARLPFGTVRSWPRGGDEPGKLGKDGSWSAVRVRNRRLMNRQVQSKRATAGSGHGDGSVDERKSDVPGTCLGQLLDSRRSCTDCNELQVPLGFPRVLRKLQRCGQPIAGMRRQIVVWKFEVRSGCHERIEVGGFERGVDQEMSPWFSDSIVPDRLPLGQRRRQAPPDQPVATGRPWAACGPSEHGSSQSWMTGSGRQRAFGTRIVRGSTAVTSCRHRKDGLRADRRTSMLPISGRLRASAARWPGSVDSQLARITGHAARAAPATPPDAFGSWAGVVHRAARPRLRRQRRPRARAHATG